MRFLVQVTLPVEEVNKAMKHGKFGSTMESILSEIKPEAAYFTELDGCRTAVLIVNLAQTNEIVRIAEPFFIAFGAKVEFHPAMTVEDLQNGAHHIEAAVKSFG